MSRRARLAASTGTDSGSPGHPSSRLHTKPSSPKNTAPCVLHMQPRPWISPALSVQGAMCKQRPGEPEVLGTPNLCYKASAGLSYPSFSADSAALGQGCCWFMPTCNMNLSRENAEAVDPQDCPHRLCLDPKSGSTGSAGRAPGWPCPVCQWQLGLAAHRDGHCPTVPMSTQAAVLLPSMRDGQLLSPELPPKNPAWPSHAESLPLPSPPPWPLELPHSKAGVSLSLQSPLCPQGSV